MNAMWKKAASWEKSKERKQKEAAEIARNKEEYCKHLIEMGKAMGYLK